MKKIIKQINEITEKILKGKFKAIDKTDVPKKQGVYVIKETSGRFFDKKIFYVGKSTNLFKRIVRSHVSKDIIPGSILRKKLNRKGMEYLDIQDYLKKECLFIVQEIEGYDITAIVEDLLIAVLRKQKEPLLNELK